MSKSLKIKLSCGSYETEMDCLVESYEEASSCVREFFIGVNEHFRLSNEHSKQFFNQSQNNKPREKYIKFKVFEE